MMALAIGGVAGSRVVEMVVTPGDGVGNRWCGGQQGFLVIKNHKKPKKFNIYLKIIKYYLYYTKIQVFS